MSAAGAASMAQPQLLQLFQAGRYRDVLEKAQQLNLPLRQDPLAAQVVAAALFQLGEFAKAAELLEQHEAALGSDGSFLSLYGATCRRLGQLSQARALLSRALALDPLSPQVRNNFANVLIDLGELAEARRILEQLLVEDAGYSDARANLNRLEFRQQSTTAPAAAATSADPASWMPADPLMLAFAEDEVSQAGAVNFTKPASQSAAALASQLPNPNQAAVATDQLKLAARAIQENNAAFALQLVSQAALSLGAQAPIYVNAADAYIRLQRFHEAEICLLQALQLGGPALPHYINLISLTCLRGDFALARHYLDAAAAIDPANSQLAQVRDQVQRQEAERKSHYSFQLQWSLPSLSPGKVAS